MDNLLPIIQTSLILNTRTGNMFKDIFNTILATFVIYLIKKLMDNLDNIISLLKNKVNHIHKIKSEYVIQGTVQRSSEYCYHMVNFPEEFRAIIYKITKLGINIESAKKFNNCNIKYSLDVDRDNHNVHSMFCYSINTDKEIKLSDDIFVKQLNLVDKSNDLKSSIEFYNLSLYSYNLSFNDLRKTVDKWLAEYRDFIKEYNDGQYYYFSYLGGNRIKQNDKLFLSSDVDIKFESHKFSSNKTFDNIFFDQKDLLIRRLDYFQKSESEYKRLGIPYTLGLLFHGEPGCGKTSTIKAIANYTKRHVVEIPLSKIKTCGELKKIFFSEIINEQYVPSCKKIIVLEDIDCMGNIVKKRNYDLEINNENIIDNLNEKTKKELLEKYLAYRHSEDEDQLNLSYILNLIDGVLEQPGRILIITSNHPDKLDDALLRPGRIDTKIYFGKCSKVIVKQIIELYFDIILDKEKHKHMQLSNNKFTPAEIFQLCFTYNDLDEVIKFICD